MDQNSESEDVLSETNMNSLEYAIKRSLLSRNKLAIIMKNPDGVVQFCCVECTYKCDNKVALERHLLAHNKEYRYLCGICGTGLKRREHLDRHTLEHQEVRPHVCPVCGKAFKRKEHMNIHRSIHSGDKNELCPICNKSFYRKDHLRKHLQTHSKMLMEENVHPLYDQVLVEIKQEMMDEDVKPNIAELEMQTQDMEIHSQDTEIYSQDTEINSQDTEIESQDMEMYTQDMEEGHDEVGDNEDISEAQQDDASEEYKPVLPIKGNKIDRPYACYLCHKSYKRRDHLKIHSWTHIKKDKVCTECGKAYHLEEQLQRHMNTHLPQYEDADSGDQNCESFSSESSMPIVQSAKLKAESRPHACAVCQRRFKRKQHLKQHLNVHFRAHQPSVWCSICGEGFLSNSKFEKHQCVASSQDNNSENETGDARMIPMGGKKENKYPKEYMDISELAALDAHDESVQYISEHELPIPQRVFVCKYCTKPFKRKDHYKIHLNIHTGIKTFFCPTCGKGFYRKDHMQKHMQVHNKSREKPPRRDIPDLFPISMVARTSDIKPEITIHAPSSTKLRVPLQMKVPYQMVVSLDNGEKHAVTIDPQAPTHELSS